MASIFNQFDWYWKVLDTNPTTHVYSTRVGAFIVIGDATYVAWLAADGGNTPTTIDTFASLCKVINQFAAVNYVPRAQSFTVTADVTLTNPPPNFVDFTNNTGLTKKLILPVANSPISLPVGVPMTFRNLSVGGGAFPCTVCLNDGGAGTTVLFQVMAGATVTILLKLNSSYNGTWDARIVGDVVKDADNVFTKVNFFNGDRTVMGTTASPDSYLLSMHGTATGAGASQSLNQWSADASSPQIYIRKSRGASPATFSPLQNNDYLGWISFDASHTVGFVNGANISAKNIGAITGTNFPATALQFWTSPGGSVSAVPVLRMTINPDGSVTFTSGITTAGLKGSDGTANAAAGDVGEFLQTSNVVASGSLTTGVIGTYHSISLTAGDWDVWAHTTSVAGPTAGNMEFELTTGASLSGSPFVYVITVLAFAGAQQNVDIQPVRFRVAATTTVNLNYRASVTGTAITNAYIAARRRR